MAAKRAARAEARVIRMKELERAQQEVCSYFKPAISPINSYCLKLFCRISFQKSWLLKTFKFMQVFIKYEIAHLLHNASVREGGGCLELL